MRVFLFPAAAAMFMLAAIPAHSQLGVLHKNKDKEAERVEKEEKRDAKNMKSYEKIKTYSLDKYASDPDFRDEVDQAYADLLREHKDLAFEKNTHRGSKVYAVNEDRFRMNDQRELYDNLLVQSRINRIGQSLVPKDSDRMFAFRLTADPTPTADTLATGTIYISTGMVSLLDNEAQLAYVLGHEMAHVQLDHWKQKVMMERGIEAYNADQTKKAEKIAVVGGLAGALTGGLISKSAGGAVAGGLIGAGGGLIAGLLLNRHAVLNWDRAQEDEADKMAFKVMLDTKYDPREVPKLYALVDAVVARDQRVGLGFLGERNRIKERKDTAEKLIADAYKADIEAQLKGKGFQGDSAGHRNLMAELKRDNGIMAYYSDMFQVARKNLEEAVAIRDNDPTAQYYYGKTLETIGRAPEDRKLAEESFVKAAQYDERQQENFGAHLHRALMMIEDDKLENQTLTNELDTYVKDYVRYQIEYSKSLLLPPNINTISEYMRRFGSADWHPDMTGTEGVRVSENMLPSTPAPAGAAKVTPARANVCPPGTVPVMAGAGGLKGAAGGAAACEAATVLKKK